LKKLITTVKDMKGILLMAAGGVVVFRIKLMVADTKGFGFMAAKKVVVLNTIKMVVSCAKAFGKILIL
jgi:hypothetical protein